MTEKNKTEETKTRKDARCPGPGHQNCESGPSALSAHVGFGIVVPCTCAYWRFLRIGTPFLDALKRKQKGSHLPAGVPNFEKHPRRAARWAEKQECRQVKLTDRWAASGGSTHAISPTSKGRRSQLRRPNLHNGRLVPGYQAVLPHGNWRLRHLRNALPWFVTVVAIPSDFRRGQRDHQLQGQGHLRAWMGTIKESLGQAGGGGFGSPGCLTQIPSRVHPDHSVVIAWSWHRHCFKRPRPIAASMFNATRHVEP